MPLSVDFDTRKDSLITKVYGKVDYTDAFQLNLASSVDYRLFLDDVTCDTKINNVPVGSFGLVNVSGVLQLKDTKTGGLKASVTGGIGKEILVKKEYKILTFI